MLLSDLVTVALIPSLLAPTDNSSSEQGVNENGGRSQEPVFSSEDLFGNDEFFNNPKFPTKSVDPFLQNIYDEENRLDLAEGFDDIGSDEARELISFQRRTLNNQQRAFTPSIIPNPSEGNREARGRFVLASDANDGSPFFFGPNNEKFNPGSLTSTEFSILLPPASPDEEVPEEVETTTTSRSVLGRLGFGVYNKVKTGVGSVVGTISRPFKGSSFQTTSRPQLPTPNTMWFGGGSNNLENPTGSNSIVFGNGNLNCNENQVVYNGACFNVLQQLPCPEGQWLIEDDTTGKGKCVENKCDGLKGHAWFGGKCVLVRTNKGECHEGMITYIFKNGEVECDCDEQHLFNPKDGNCYPAFRQGPCGPGQIFTAKITKQKTLPPTCMKSKCSQDGFFCNAPACPNDRNCIELNSPCDNGRYEIDPKTLAPKCLGFDTFKPDRIIGNVPTLACAPGSRRDILGTCRKPTTFSFS